MTLRIDPEFKDYLGPLDAEARQALEASLMAEGCRDALVVWPQEDGGAVLLDGHNRFEICERQGVAFHTVNCPDSIADRDDAVAWIVQNQRARRNLTKTQFTYLIGMAYKTAKEAKGGDRGNQYTVAMDQNDLLPKANTAERMADNFGVSPPTVKRAEKIADTINTIAAEHGLEAKQDILSGRKKLADYVPEPAISIRAANAPQERESVEESVPAPEEGAAPEPEPAASPDSVPTGYIPARLSRGERERLDAEAEERFRNAPPPDDLTFENVVERRPLVWAPPHVPPVDPETLPKDADEAGAAVFLKLCEVYRTLATLAQYPPVDDRHKSVIRKQGRLVIETSEKLLKTLL